MKKKKKASKLTNARARARERIPRPPPNHGAPSHEAAAAAPSSSCCRIRFIRAGPIRICRGASVCGPPRAAAHGSRAGALDVSVGPRLPTTRAPLDVLSRLARRRPSYAYIVPPLHCKNPPPSQPTRFSLLFANAPGSSERCKMHYRLLFAERVFAAAVVYSWVARPL